MNSRLAAYEVLVMLADSSPANLQIITKELLSMHHQPDPALTKEFDVSFLDLDTLEFCLGCSIKRITLKPVSALP